jgi:hypothetical protein
MKARLKRDLVIKAGTIFNDAPEKIILSGDHVDCIRAVGKDSYAQVIVDLDKDVKRSWGYYFEVIE